MNYPNTNQISALLGRRIRPDYQSYIQPQIQALPQYLQLQESRDYNDQMLDLEQQRTNLEQQQINEQQRQFGLNYELAQEQAEAAKKNQMYGNLISGAGLGLNAYQALDEAGVDFSGVGSALKSVMPNMGAATDTMSNVASVVDPPMRSFSSGGGTGALDSLAGGVNDWVVGPATQVAEGVGDFVTETIPSAAKYVTGGDMWSDVSGFVEGLFS